MPEDSPITPAPAATTTPAREVKETKAQKSERLKLAKNPWEAWDEVRQYAKEGREHVDAAWTGLYFKWWGIYTQGDGLGATGGVGGEGKSTDFFMMRIGLPNGLLTSHQLRVIAGITKKYARNLADITTRQNIQLHWLTIAALVEVTDQLTEIGLSPKGACGDVVRNVTGCPLAGLDNHELLDASPLAVEIAHHLTANPAFYNLPRKFKISVTGCPLWCSYPEINDVALTAIRREVLGLAEVGYTLRVGGGLSTEPHMAVRIPCFVQQSQALAVVTAVAEVFREQSELRENRTRARIKYLFMRHGWTAETMLHAIEQKLGYKLDPDPLTEAANSATRLELGAPSQSASSIEVGSSPTSGAPSIAPSAMGGSTESTTTAASPRQPVPEQIPDDIYRDHVGITPQSTPGLSAVGASILRGRLSGDQLEALANLAEKYGDGHLRATIMQNIILVNIRNENVRDLIHDLKQIDIEVEVSPFWRGAIACTGTEFCKLAIAETKAFSKWLVSEMEERLPGFDQQIKLHVTGCTNSCGQHWIADIGLEGKKLKVDGVLTDAFYFCVGGSVGKFAGPARQLGYRAAAHDVPDAIDRLLRGYLAVRAPAEDLRAYFARTSDEDLRAQLNGQPMPPVARDAPPAGGRHAPDA